MSGVLRGSKVKASKVQLRMWRVLPYKEIEETLKGGEGYVYFIEGIKRQTANSAATRLTGKLGFKVEAHSAVYGGRKGYVFIRGTMNDLERRAYE